MKNKLITLGVTTLASAIFTPLIGGAVLGYVLFKDEVSVKNVVIKKAKTLFNNLMK